MLDYVFYADQVQLNEEETNDEYKKPLKELNKITAYRSVVRKAANMLSIKI